MSDSTNESSARVKSLSVLPSTVSDAFNIYFLKEIPLLKYCVFDPDSSYATSLKLLRASLLEKSGINIPSDDEYNPKTKKTVKDSNIFPFLSWNRTNLGKSILGNAKNISLKKVFNETDGKYYDFDGGNSDFTYNFTIFSKNPVDLERIELMFSSGLNKYFTNFTNMYINIESIGSFMYNLIWNNLETVTFNIDANYYQSLSGSVTICGLFFTITETDDSGIIKDIEFTIGSCCGLVSEDHYTIKSQEEI